jgi:hypothetical protein
MRMRNLVRLLPGPKGANASKSAFNPLCVDKNQCSENLQENCSACNSDMKCSITNLWRWHIILMSAGSGLLVNNTDGILA